MLSDFKSELKLFFIVVAVSAVLAAGGVLFLQTVYAPEDTPVSQEEATGRRYSSRDTNSSTCNSPYRIPFCGAGFQWFWDETGCGCEPIPAQRPTPAPTPSPQSQATDLSEWQTYRNEEFGFEFQYPNDEWRLLQPAGNKLPFLRKIKAREFPVTQIWFDVFTIPEDGQSVEDIATQKTALGESSESIGSIDPFEERMLGVNRTYYINDYLFEGQYRVTYYLSDGEKRVVRFYLSEFTTTARWTDPGWNADKEPNHSTLKQILSTFRFVEG